RMAVTSTLRWIEVDLPELLAYKEEMLKGEKPRCNVERIALDLADVARRRALFAQIGASSKRVMIVSEGLLIYISPDDVGVLATDLAKQPTFRYWVLDVVSPGLMEMLRKEGGSELERAGAPCQFAPPAGPDICRRYRWRRLDRRPTVKAAHRP